MPRQPQVLVKDRETGHVYPVSEARYKRTPKLWDRVEPVPAKPKTTVSREAAKKRAAKTAPAKKATSGRQADSKKENA